MRSAFLIDLAISVALCTRVLAVQPPGLQDFLEGRKVTFSTNGHPKAKGVELRISYPESWAVMEGERPNIVQKFVSEHGRGLDSAMIITQTLPFPADTVVSLDDQRSLFASSELKEMMPSGATLINVRATEIEGLPAGITEYSMHVDRAGMQLYIHAWTLSFLSASTLVQIQFQVGGVAGEEAEVSHRMESMRPLFSLMANSVVLPKKWTTTPVSPSQTVTLPSGLSTPPSQQDFVQYRDEEHKFSIHYPRSWARVEATHPQTRFKAVSDGGSGGDDLSVVVTSLPRPANPFPDEFVKSIDAKEYLANLRRIIPETKLIKHGPTTLSNQAAYYFVTDTTHRILGLDVPMRQIQVQTAHNGSVYTITFRTDPGESADFPILFQVITGGFVLWPDQPDVVGGRSKHTLEDRALDAARRGAISALSLIALFGAGAALVRFVLIRRALSRLWGVGVAGSTWFLLLALHHQTSEGRSPPSWISAGAVVAFFVLTSGRTRRADESGDQTGSNIPPD